MTLRSLLPLKAFAALAVATTVTLTMVLFAGGCNTMNKGKTEVAAAKKSVGSALSADKIETLSVGAGQVACVVATSDRNIELLWKAQKAAPATMMLARR